MLAPTGMLLLLCAALEAECNALTDRTESDAACCCSSWHAESCRCNCSVHEADVDHQVQVAEVDLTLVLMLARWTRTLPDGRIQSGFFAVNFTLAELKTVYAEQTIPGRSQALNHEYRYHS